MRGGASDEATRSMKSATLRQPKAATLPLDQAISVIAILQLGPKSPCNLQKTVPKDMRPLPGQSTSSFRFTLVISKSSFDDIRESRVIKCNQLQFPNRASKRAPSLRLAQIASQSSQQSAAPIFGAGGSFRGCCDNAVTDSSNKQQTKNQICKFHRRFRHKMVANK